MLEQINKDFVDNFLTRPATMFIDGDWCEAIDGAPIDVINPSNKEIIYASAGGGAKDIDLAVRAARRAFDGTWSKVKPAERARLLFKLADLIESRTEQFALLESLDVGMPYMMARMGLIPAVVAGIRYTAGWATKLNGETRDVSNPGEWHSFTYREAIGVAGLITPWNVPMAITMNKVAPAIAAGCTVVLKPAENTPLTALLLAELVAEAGFPNGVINIVTGLGTTAGAALVDHPLVDKISFTGSTLVGKHIISRCADTLKRVSMELGGKSPVFVFEDADLDKAIDGAAKAIFSNTGQVCAAGSRLFVHKKLFDKVIEGVAQKAKKLKVGAGTNFDTEIGPVVSDKQLERVMGYINSGIESGAEIVAGGKTIDGSGYFVEPTVFVNTNPEMQIVREEIFGPVLCAVPFDDENIDALADMGNNTIYGLNSLIFTNNISKGHKLARRLKAGNVRINTNFGLDPAMPFGGYKQSGFGRESGREGVEAYTELKSVAVFLD